MMNLFSMKEPMTTGITGIVVGFNSFNQFNNSQCAQYASVTNGSYRQAQGHPFGMPLRFMARSK